MKKRIINFIVCVMLISALMIGFCTAYASAATPVWLLRAKAGIAAAMMAANIVFEPYVAAQGQALADVIDPLGIVQTVNDSAWSDYIDQSVIVVRPDNVTIDGQEYSEIWLGSQAANSLRASGFDFTTAYNILANQSQAVQYASGEGFVMGIPIYRVRNKLQSATTVFPAANGTYQYGNGTINVRQYNDTNQFQTGFSGPGQDSYVYSIRTTGQQYAVVEGQQNWQGTFYVRNGLGGNAIYNVSNKAPSDIVPAAFEFDYTSGLIDPDPIDSDQGLLLRVPSSYDSGDPSSVYNYDIHDLVNVYPQFDDTNGHELVFDPSLNPDFDVDLDMGNALGDIITAVILAKLADLLGDHADVIYAPMPEKEDPSPVDPDLPDPDVPIGEQDPVWLDNLLRWLKQTIDYLGDRINDAIDTIHEDIQEIISQIEQLADKILEDIELGPSKLFDKALDILKTLFLPLLLPIRAMMNLWHYVVEWIGSISSPFTWIFGIMSGTSGNMVLPIYSLLAGGICISIYKALGR